MSIKLFLQAIIKFAMGVLITGVLLFIPAGSFGYWNGLLFMGILFIPMFIAGIVLMFKNPELLKKRLNNKEKESEQKVVIILSAIMFLAGFIIAGLNYRYNWIELPRIVVYIATVLFFISYILYAEVLRENEYLSRTIEVQENQESRFADYTLAASYNNNTFLKYATNTWITYIICNIFGISNNNCKKNKK